MLYSSSSVNKSFLKSTPDSIKTANTVNTFNIRDTPYVATFKIPASSNPDYFMNSLFNTSASPEPTKARSTPRVNRINDKIWSQTSTKKPTTDDKPVEVVFFDSSHSDKNTMEIITINSTPNKEAQVVKAEALRTNQKETEEHEIGATNSISDIIL